jgi:MFS family permease
MNVNSPLRLSISNDAPKEATTTISPTPSSLTSSQSLIEKAAYRKADIRLLLWYSFVYLIMRIHVQNVTNSAIMNLETGHGIKAQLGGLSSEQWAMVISIFYYPYMFLEPPATLLLKRFSPSKWMARIMITWGIISMCQGAAQSYAGLLICRFFLGAAEAGFYPGVLYHLSFWYPSDQMALRFAFFYACGMFSGTIGGLLAYAISFMNGVAGLAGWRWMFILEGIPAIFCGLYTYFFLPDYPDSSKFFSEDEKRAIVANLPATQPSSKAKTWDWSQAKTLFMDPTFFTFTLLWICHAIGGWGVSTVLPTVIYELGMTGTAIAQLMTMVSLRSLNVAVLTSILANLPFTQPTYAFGCTCLVLIGWLIHRKLVSPWAAAIASK